MTYQKYVHTLVYLYLCSIFHVTSADQACDKSKCNGPVEYYEELRCTPIYGSGDSCCAVKYNCDHLKERSTDKCYINGNVYEIGQDLREEDARPCDIGCVCSSGYNGVASFNCKVVDCFQESAKPGCYRKRSLQECCDGEEVCPKDESQIPKCEVDGKTYLDGDYFSPKSDPELNCICLAGYTGENVEPFCKPQQSCSVELRSAPDIYNNCTPAFYSSQNPSTDCSVFSRCQNDNDTVIEAPAGATNATEGYTCTFGQLTMKRGDELNSGTDYSSVCLKCVCEVPPLPTCQRLPDSECDVTAHAEFE